MREGNCEIILGGDYMTDMASRLLRLREEEGYKKGSPITQEEVAKAVGCSSNYLSMLEKGLRQDPSLSLLEALADYYGVSLDYLRGRTDDPTPPQKQSQPTGIRISRDYPLPPKGYEDLSPEEREEVDRITREFEDFHIQRILERKRREKGAP